MTPKAVIPRSASEEGSPLMEEGYALLQLHPRRIFAVLGIVGKGTPLPIMSLRDDFTRSFLR